VAPSRAMRSRQRTTTLPASRRVSALGGAETVATPLAETLRDAGKVVVLWGERIARDGATDALLALADALGIATTAGSGLLEIPDTTNARGLRESGCLPDAGPGLSEPNQAFGVQGTQKAQLVGKGTEEIRAALESGEIESLLLFGVDPLRDFPDTLAWERALTACKHLVVFSMFETATTAKASVVFPLETHAEKDGTVTHPDGRLQRVRPSASRPGDIRPNIQVLSQLSAALGHDTGIDSQPAAFAALRATVPFYADIDDSDIGGKGIRWQDTSSASAIPSGSKTPAAERAPEPGSGAPPPSGTAATLALGTYRDLWAGPITELNPPLRFLQPRQRLEISIADAERLTLKQGERVLVSQNGSSVEAEVQIKERVSEGIVFLAEGLAEGNANGLLNGGPVRVEIQKLSEVQA